MGADDRMPSVHMIFLVEEMHRAAKSLRAATGFPEEFRHAGVRAGSARESMTVVPIRGDNVIVIPDRGNGANDNRFLSNVQVAEAADLLRLILLARAFLETPNQQHQREHLDFVALLGTLHRILCEARQRSSSARPAGLSPKIHAHHEKQREEQIAQDWVTKKHPSRR